MKLPENMPSIRWRRAFRRRLSQAMRTSPVRVIGSRWNRPCIFEQLDACGHDCICNRPQIVVMRSRGCNRVACSFLKWCHVTPGRSEEDPPFRSKWGAPGKVTYLPPFLRGYSQPFGPR